jgi:mRNA-degrading endonuclease RelE of RelBE toxin-antitoxin system
MRDAPRPLELVLTRHAERDLLVLPHALRQRVKADIIRLAQGTIPLGQLKKLHGFSPPLWQLTSGAFRVFYRRTGEQLLLLRVAHKPKQQRILRDLR